LANPLNRLLAHGALFIAATIWGVSFLVVKDALPNIRVLHLLCLRFLLASILLVPISQMSLRKLWQEKGAMRVGLVLFVAFAFQTTGLRSTTPSRSAFLTALSIVFVPLIQWAWKRHLVQMHQMMAIIVATVGLILLYLPSLGATSFVLGDLLSLLSGFFFGLHFIVAEDALQSRSSVSVVALQSITVMLLAAPSFLVDRPSPEEFSARSIGAVLFTGVLASGVAFWLQLFAQKRVSAVEASLTLALEPVIASAASFMAGVEKVSLAVILGGAFLLAAIFLAQVEFLSRR
jgi:drug/metabolite transporter (DMT)-like permease